MRACVAVTEIRHGDGPLREEAHQRRVGISCAVLPQANAVVEEGSAADRDVRAGRSCTDTGGVRLRTNQAPSTRCGAAAQVCLVCEADQRDWSLTTDLD